MEIVNRNGYFEDNCYIYIDLQELLIIHLDSEQKRILKAISGTCLGFIVGYPLLMWVFGRVESWKDALIWLGAGLIVAVLMGAFYVIGSKIPRKDEQKKEPPTLNHLPSGFLAVLCSFLIIYPATSEGRVRQ